MEGKVLSMRNSATWKGLMILVIVIGHNTWFSLNHPEWRKVFYFFNVHAFFLLVFTRPASNDLGKTWSVYIFRYLIPYFTFATLGFLLYHFGLGGRTPGLEELKTFGLALWTGDMYRLEDSTGIQLFWFLPALFSLILVRTLGSKYPMMDKLFCLLGILWILGVDETSTGIYFEFLPLNLEAGFYLYPQGRLLEIMWRKRSFVSRKQQWISTWIALTASAILIIVIVKANLGYVTVVGPYLGQWHSFPTLLVSLLLPFFFFIGAGGLVDLLPQLPGIVSLGKYSLQVYLLHVFISTGLLFVMFNAKMPNAQLQANTWWTGYPVIIFTTVISLLSSFGLMAIPVTKKVLFPADGQEWLGVWRRKAT
jgi:hypothetical protein